MRRIWSFSKPRIPYRTGTFLISTPNKPQDHEESGPERAAAAPASGVRWERSGARELVVGLRWGAGLQLGTGRLIGGRRNRMGRVALARSPRGRVAHDAGGHDL